MKSRKRHRKSFPEEVVTKQKQKGPPPMLWKKRLLLPPLLPPLRKQNMLLLTVRRQLVRYRKKSHYQRKDAFYHLKRMKGKIRLVWFCGIEAEAAMLGQPVSMLIPRVVGFKLTGEIKPGVT